VVLLPHRIRFVSFVDGIVLALSGRGSSAHQLCHGAKGVRYSGRTAGVHKGIRHCGPQGAAGFGETRRSWPRRRRGGYIRLRFGRPIGKGRPCGGTEARPGNSGRALRVMTGTPIHRGAGRSRHFHCGIGIECEDRCAPAVDIFGPLQGLANSTALGGNARMQEAPRSLRAWPRGQTISSREVGARRERRAQQCRKSSLICTIVKRAKGTKPFRALAGKQPGGNS